MKRDKKKTEMETTRPFLNPFVEFSPRDNLKEIIKKMKFNVFFIDIFVSLVGKDKKTSQICERAYVLEFHSRPIDVATEI